MLLLVVVVVVLVVVVEIVATALCVREAGIMPIRLAVLQMLVVRVHHRRMKGTLLPGNTHQTISSTSCNNTTNHNSIHNNNSNNSNSVSTFPTL